MVVVSLLYLDEHDEKGQIDYKMLATQYLNGDKPNDGKNLHKLLIPLRLPFQEKFP